VRKVIAALLVLLTPVLAWTAPEKRPRAPGYLKVQRFKPRHGKTFVPLDAKIRVRFSRAIDLATVTPSTAQLITLGGDRVDVTYSEFAGGKQLVLTPVQGLRPGTDYAVVVKPGLKAKDGATLKAERHANFYTLARVSPLSILRPDQFEDLPSTMSEGRAAHSATRMADGRVLLAGGMTDYVGFAISGDVFNPQTKAFSNAGGRLNELRAYHPSERFGTATILIGGVGPLGALDSTDVYFAQTQTFLVGPRLNEPRDYVATCALKDGRILVVGGLRYEVQGAIYSDTAEIYDGDFGGFRFTKSAPLHRRAGHSMTLLPDGRVLIVGGLSGGASTPVTAEIFDPVTETFTETVGAPAYHRQVHAATLVDDTTGRVLLVDGGAPLLEMFDPTTSSFFPAGGASSVNRIGATASLLPDGRVLIAGGLEDRGGGGNDILLDSFDLWVPSGGDHGSVLRPTVIFSEPRYGHTATTLHDGKILFAGGFGTGTEESLYTATLFTPDPPK
jgi:hypothetical protein